MNSLKYRNSPLIAACDWSVSSHKRWLAAAEWHGERWVVDPPALVGPPDSLFPPLVKRARGRSILAGFDFPIRIPRRFAELNGIESFTAWLLQLGEGHWADLYGVCESAQEISLLRPFYPRAPGGRRKQHLIDGLGLTHTDELLRICERATALRGKACEIFWTLGASQVGRAAIAGWRDLLAPAVREGIIALWPFDNLYSKSITMAEIYPAETYAHIGLPRSFGKSSAESRGRQIPRIIDWCERHSIELGCSIGECRTDDEFDAIIGALGMIEAVSEPRCFTLPEDPAIRSVEGWIFGMAIQPAG